MAIVKGSHRRQQQKELTRAQIVLAADSLFRKRGYLPATIEAIADAAGVAVQTIYNSVGNKAALLNAVLDLTVSGPDSRTSVAVTMRERTDASPDLDDMVGVLARWFAEVNPRSAALFALIRQAAAIDPEVAALETARSQQRLHNYALAAERARVLGGLGPATTDAQAAAAIWALAHPDVYRALVIDGEMTEREYLAWMSNALGRLLAGRPQEGDRP